MRTSFSLENLTYKRRDEIPQIQREEKKTKILMKLYKKEHTGSSLALEGETGNTCEDSYLFLIYSL